MLITSTEELIEKLGLTGGAIVSSSSCSTMEIADARVRGDLYVDEHGLGYILRSKKWLDKAQDSISGL